MHRHPGDLPTPEQDGTRVGLDFARELIDEGRFSRTVRTDQRVDLSRIHLEREVAAGLNRAEPAVEPPDLEQRLHQVRPPVSKP